MQKILPRATDPNRCETKQFLQNGSKTKLVLLDFYHTHRLLLNKHVRNPKYTALTSQKVKYLSFIHWIVYQLQKDNNVLISDFYDSLGRLRWNMLMCFICKKTQVCDFLKGSILKKQIESNNYGIFLQIKLFTQIPESQVNYYTDIATNLISLCLSRIIKLQLVINDYSKEDSKKLVYHQLDPILRDNIKPLNYIIDITSEESWQQIQEYIDSSLSFNRIRHYTQDKKHMCKFLLYILRAIKGFCCVNDNNYTAFVFSNFCSLKYFTQAASRKLCNIQALLSFILGRYIKITYKIASDIVPTYLDYEGKSVLHKSHFSYIDFSLFPWKKIKDFNEVKGFLLHFCSHYKYRELLSNLNIVVYKNLNTAIISLNPIKNSKIDKDILRLSIQNKYLEILIRTAFLNMQLYLNQKLTEVKIVLSEIDPNITKFLFDIPPLNIQFNSSNAQLFFKTIKDNSELDIDKILKNSITFFLCGIIWIYTPNLSICDIKKYNSIQVFSQLITYLANESYSIFFTHKNTKLELDIPKIGKYRLYCMFACTDVAYLFTDIKILKIVDKLLDREFIARVYYCLLPKEDFTSYVTQRDKIDTIIRNILFYYFNHRVVIKFTESQYNNTRVRYLKSSIDLQFLSSRYLEFIRKYLV